MLRGNVRLSSRAAQILPKSHIRGMFATTPLAVNRSHRAAFNAVYDLLCLEGTWHLNVAYVKLAARVQPSSHTSSTFVTTPLRSRPNSLCRLQGHPRLSTFRKYLVSQHCVAMSDFLREFDRNHTLVARLLPRLFAGVSWVQSEPTDSDTSCADHYHSSAIQHVAGCLRIRKNKRTRLVDGWC